MFQFLLKKKDIYIIDNFKFCKIHSCPNAILLGINEKNFSKYQKNIILSGCINARYENGFLIMTNKFYSYYFRIEDYIGMNSHLIIEGYIEVGLVLLNELDELKSTTCKIFSVKVYEDNNRGNLFLTRFL